MDCMHSKGALRPGKASYTVSRKGYHLILDDIPAFVCDPCGQPLFSEESVRRIQEMVRSLDDRKRELGRSLSA